MEWSGLSIRSLWSQFNSYLMLLSCSSFTKQSIGFIQKNCCRSVVSSKLYTWLIVALFLLWTWKRIRINFSLSPLHLLASEEQRTLKNVVWNLAATAFASIVLPVPGGPKSRRLLTEFENMRVCSREAKMLGKLRGRVTQSWSDCLAWKIFCLHERQVG